jgi:anti-sigma B factor antagonist
MGHRAAVVPQTRKRKDMAASRLIDNGGVAEVQLSRWELEPFRCEVEPARDAAHVRPVGELDLATVPMVEGQLADLWAVGFSRLVLDLRGVRFLDATGVRLLVSWAAACEADGIAFLVIQGPAVVQRVLRVTFVSPNGTRPRVQTGERDIAVRRETADASSKS